MKSRAFTIHTGLRCWRIINADVNHSQLLSIICAAVNF